MNSQIRFVVYAKPTPQGSMKGFVLPGKGGRGPRAIITSANKNLKPYRQEVTNSAQGELANLGVRAPFADKHVPVELMLDFYLERPASIAKKRRHVVVKPDIDKLARSTIDSLTGVLYQDDAQIVSLVLAKHYGVPERVEVSMAILEPVADVLPLAQVGLRELPF